MAKRRKLTKREAKAWVPRGESITLKGAGDDPGRITIIDPVAPALMAFPARTDSGKFIGNVVSLMTLGVQATIKDLLRLTHGIAGLVGVEEAKAIVEGSLNAMGDEVKVHLHTEAQRRQSHAPQVRKGRGGRRTLSPEGRARIIAAQKARREREALLLNKRVKTSARKK